MLGKSGKPARAVPESPRCASPLGKGCGKPGLEMWIRRASIGRGQVRACLSPKHPPDIHSFCSSHAVDINPESAGVPASELSAYGDLTPGGGFC